MTIKVAHLVHDFCPNGNEFVYRLTVNPHSRNSVFCAYRNQAQSYPHDNVSIYKTSWRILNLLSEFNRNLAERAFLKMRRREWQRFLKRHAPDVVHVQFGTTLVDHLDLLRETNIPILCTFHGSDVNSATFNAQYHDRLVAGFGVIQKAHFVSQRLKEHACELGLEPSKAAVIRLGTKSQDAVAPERTNRAVPKLTCVARMVSCKGHETLLQAAARLRDEGVPFHLELIGDGPLHHRLEWLAGQLNLTDTVTFRGELAHLETLREIESSDLVVLASQVADNGQAEGIPVTLMEAGARGVPVVSTRCGGIPELVIDGSTGLLVEPRDVAGLAGAIRKLLEDDSLRRTLGDTAGRRIREEFNAENSLLQIAQLYEQMLEPQAS